MTSERSRRTASLNFATSDLQMIRQQDAEFHPATAGDHRFAETNYFCFTIPEEHLMVTVYTVFRKGIGVMSSDIVVYGDLVRDRAECLYIDNQQHLPAPERLSDYRTANGLHVVAKSVRDYSVRYQGYDDLSFEFDFRGLMEPFDIHDPNHSPKAQVTVAAQHAGSGLGASYGGHFDLTGRVTGLFRMKGRTYTIDCVETMDHSWGPRTELGIGSMAWMCAHFGDDLAIHWISAWDSSRKPDQQHRLAHGYVMENGATVGLTDMSLSVRHVGRIITGLDVEVVDIKGRCFSMTGTGIVGGPWECYLCLEAYAALVRWRLGNGRLGYGMAQEVDSMQTLNRRLGRRARA